MKKIVVPIDFSEQSINALHYAVAMNGNSHTEIILFHAVEYPVPVGLEYGIANGDVLGDQMVTSMSAAEEKLNALIRTLPQSNIQYKVAVEMGTLINWVQNYLPEEKSDLVVIGTTGATGLKGVFVGSNAEKVVRFACCPVLAVPSEATWKSINNIVVPFESREMTDDFLHSLKEIQLLSDATIQLVWVKTPHSLVNEEDLISEMAECISSHGIQNFRVNTRRGFSPAEGILTFVEETNSELIAMPTHGRKGLKHLFMDSVTEAVVNKTDIPVWTFNIGIEQKVSEKI